MTKEEMLDGETVTFLKEFLQTPYAIDLMGYEITMLKMAKDYVEPFPNNFCGQCSYYKTPKCTMVTYNDVIKKSDKVCSDFYPDRHIARDKLKKPRIVQRRVE